MKMEEEYCLSQYQDLGKINDRKDIRLKRHKIYGNICVEKHVDADLFRIYDFVKKNPAPYFPFIYECIKNGSELIVIEEYIEGRNIEEILQEKLFAEEEGAWIILEICRALSILHHAKPQIVHRDLTAENVMISNSGQVKIIDFNIAREVKRGQKRDTQVLGTQGFAAPEQQGHAQTDERTDIYSAGVLLNYMLLRKLPYQKMLKGRLSPVIEKCMKMDPKDRYQTVEELEEHIKELYPQYSDGEKGREKAIKRLIPPGFRSKTPWKMVVAVLGYLFVTWFCFSMEITKEGKVIEGISMVSEQMFIWLSQMTFIALVCDYCGCQRYFPVLRQKNWPVRMIVYAVLEFLLLFIAAFLCTIKDTMLA